MSYSDLGQPWQVGATTAHKILPTSRNPSCMYFHHPKNWSLYIFKKTKKTKKGEETIEIPLFLPDLTQLIEDPGCNGVQGTINRPDSSIIRTKLKDEGCTVLHPSEYDYMRIYPARGGKCHTTKFVKLENLAGTLIQTPDMEERANWRRELVANGTIKPPHPHIIKKILIHNRESILREAQQPHIPAAVARLSELEEKHKKLEEAALLCLEVKNYVI